MAMLATNTIRFYLGLVFVACLFHAVSPEETVDKYREELKEFEKEFHDIIDDEEHTTLFPLTGWDIAGILLSAVGLMIAAGGGIGGGGILVPLYILILGFSPKHAIPLSNITIFGGAITNTVLNIPKRHPLADRPLVDWDLILVMEPLTIGGALAGALLNKILPEWLLAISLVVLLAATAQRTIKKGVKTYKKETVALLAEEEERKESELSSLQKEEEEDSRAEEGVGLLSDETGGKPSDWVDPELQTILDEERSTPTNKVTWLCAVFVVILSINLSKGGGAFQSPLGIACGSLAYWLTNAAMFSFLLLVSYYVRAYLVKRHAAKARLRYAYAEGDVEWNSTATIKYPAMCFFAGFFAGLFGVGGGIVKGPLMLEMGVHPQVASATSAVMILYTSFTAATSFFVFGLLTYDYGALLFLVGIVFTAVGQVGVNHLVKKYKRSSYIIMSIGAVVALSAVLMGLQSIISLMTPSDLKPDNTMCGGGGE